MPWCWPHSGEVSSFSTGLGQPLPLGAARPQDVVSALGHAGGRGQEEAGGE